jgi:predicted metal-dependent hydrolase
MRANFARYQQSSLMLATAMLERHVLPVLEELLELSQEPEFVEFVAHFIKEESYHYVMFTRSIDKIETEMPALPPLPKARTEVPLRTIFWLLRLVPGRRLRIAISLTVLHFAEQVSVHASAVARGAAPRQDSFVPQVWALHAIDEGRHLQFDRLLLDKLATSRAMRRTARLAALPFCLVCTLTIHRNEAWAARQLGVRVRLRHLLGLLRSPASEFKQRVVKLIRDVAFESPRGA